MRRIFPLMTILAGALLAQSGGPLRYTRSGKLTLPDYREWIYLSSGLGMTYTSGQPPANPAFDNVFVNPAAYQAFLKTGTWPDKTALILEVRRSETRISINRAGRSQTAVLRVEAHVKDAARGGWAFYGFPGGAAEGTLFPKTADCYSCHQQHGSVDSTFVQFYPTLLETAKSKGTFRAEP